MFFANFLNCLIAEGFSYKVNQNKAMTICTVHSRAGMAHTNKLVEGFKTTRFWSKQRTEKTPDN